MILGHTPKQMELLVKVIDLYNGECWQDNKLYFYSLKLKLFVYEFAVIYH